jgi:hypothetical protein
LHLSADSKIRTRWDKDQVSGSNLVSEEKSSEYQGSLTR